MESRIDFSQFDLKEGEFKWVVGYTFPSRHGDTAKLRARNGAHAYCAEFNRPILSDDLAEYIRLTGYVAVNTVAYDACMKETTPNYLWEERKRQLIVALKHTAFVAPIALLFAAFWYRRPLGRNLRLFVSKLNRIGPE